jgi:tellurite resistance protein
VLREFRLLLDKRRDRVRGRQFLEAVMAAAAHVAAADGETSFAELLGRDLLGRDHVLKSVSELQVFEVQPAVTLFEEYADALQQDAVAGESRVFASVANVAGDIELGQALLGACVTIARADANFSQAEVDAIARLSDALGIEPIVPASSS